VRQEGQRFLLSDPMLGGEFGLAARGEEETSGYGLVSSEQPPAGWRGDRCRSQNVRGKCLGAAVGAWRPQVHTQVAVVAAGRVPWR
jgi:hypothetical protein